MNVWNTCLRLLRARGYDLRAEETGLEGRLNWWAAKDGFAMVGDNPIELLGLTALYEAVSPGDSASALPYWWTIKGPDIYQELIDTATPYQFEDDI